MRRRWMLLGVPILVMTLNGATIEEKDYASKALYKGCKSLRFNTDPQNYDYGIVLGFVKGTADAYRDQYLQSGLKPKAKKGYSSRTLTKSACRAAMEDDSQERFYDVIRTTVLEVVGNSFDGTIPSKVKKKNTPKGIEDFFDDDH